MEFFIWAAGILAVITAYYLGRRRGAKIPGSRLLNNEDGCNITVKTQDIEVIICGKTEKATAMFKDLGENSPVFQSEIAIVLKHCTIEEFLEKLWLKAFETDLKKPWFGTT